MTLKNAHSWPTRDDPAHRSRGGGFITTLTGVLRDVVPAMALLSRWFICWRVQCGGVFYVFQRQA